MRYSIPCHLENAEDMNYAYLQEAKEDLKKVQEEVEALRTEERPARIAEILSLMNKIIDQGGVWNHR